MLRQWTIGRATGVGAVAASSTLIFWPLYDRFQSFWLWPLLVMLIVAGLSGISILFITAVDLIIHRRRSRKLRPLRIFDLVVGLLLIALALTALHILSGQLPVQATSS